MPTDPLNDEHGFWSGFLEHIFGVKHNNTKLKASMLADLIDQAHETMYVTAGDLNSPLLWSNTLVLDALENLISRKTEEAEAIRKSDSKDESSEYSEDGISEGDSKLSIAFLLDENKLPNEPRLKRLLQDKRIGVRYLPDKLSGHFVVIDGKHVRVEEKHIKNKPGRVWLRRNTFMLGDRLTSDFKQLFDMAKPLGNGKG